MEGRQFTVHLDFAFSSSKNVRVSLSNIYREERFDHFSVQVPLTLPKDRWAVVCLDARGYFLKYHCMKEDEGHFLRSLTLCANLKVSRIATADKLYDANSLPRDLNFKLNKADRWEDRYAWIEPLPCDRSQVEEKAELVPQKELSEKKPHPPRVRREESVLNKENTAQNEPRRSMEPAAAEEEERKSVSLISAAAKREANPLLVLKDMIGCTTNQCPSICWSKDLKRKEMVYAAGNVIVIMDSEGRKRFCLGHTHPLVSLCVSPKGDLICSADETTIKVWDFVDCHCLGSWRPEGAPRAKCVGVSPDNNLLVSVCKDPHNRDVVTVWDLKTLSKMNAYQPHPNIVASQTNQFNVLCIKFAPGTEASDGTFQMCSCGQENIRFWRIKRGVLKCAPVVLDRSARNTVFTSLDYEGKRRVYVGSKDGTVLQINAESQELEFVYKLHDSGIYSLAVNEAFCVTGSDDLFLRVWPLDFSEFFMEAKHEATVTATDISSDGVEIVCATAHGSIGLLDISQQKYRTVARSHADDVLAIDALGERLVTVSQDKTIRVWDLKPQLQQSYEFCSFDDQALSVSLNPSGHTFACGFQSGCVRIFDIERTAVIGEYRLFSTPLCIVKYVRNEANGTNLLVTVSSEGSMAIHNGETYETVKQVPAEGTIVAPAIAVDQEKVLLATVGKSSSAVTVWSLNPLEVKNSIPIGGNAKVQDLVFLSAKTVAVLATDCTIRVFSTDGSMLYKRPSTSSPSYFLVPGLPSGNNRLLSSADSRYLVFAGADSVVRIASESSLARNQCAGLSECFGHSGAVRAALFHPSDTLAFVSAGGPEGVCMWRFHPEPEPPRKPAVEGTISVREHTIAEASNQGAQFMSVVQVGTMHSLALAPPNTDKAAAEEVLECPTDKARIEKRTELGLPMKHYVSCPEDKHTLYDDVSTRSYATRDVHVEFRQIAGYNGNAHDNVVCSESAGWVGYSLGNKLVVQDAENGKQEVYLEQEAEISVMASSATMLATGAGIPNKGTGTADICIYSINPGKEQPRLKFMKRLSFYQKGVQSLHFVSGSPDYLCSVGRYPECTLAAWDLTSGVCIASELLEIPVNQIVCGNSPWTYAVGKDTLLRWKLQTVPQPRLLVDRAVLGGKPAGYAFTSVEMLEADGGEVCVVGSSMGTIVLYDSAKDAFVNEYPMASGEVSAIAHKDGMMCVAAGKSLFTWEMSVSAPSLRKILAEKPTAEIKLDAEIVALWLKKSTVGEGECLAGTASGTLWQVFLDRQLSIRLQTTHTPASILLPQTPKVVLSSGPSGVKLFSQKTLDPVLDFAGAGKCLALVSPKIMAVGGSEGELRFFSLHELKQVGTAKLSPAAVTCGQNCGDGCVAFGDEAGAVYVVSKISDDPLAFGYQKVLNLYRSL